MQRNFAEVGNEYRLANRVYSTVAIGPDLILNPDHFNTIIDEIINYPIDGVYLIYQHPINEYLINEDFLFVLLDAILSISLSGKEIILGYANHQSIIFYAAGIDKIASGNYRNVRSFDHQNTSERGDEDNLRKSVWYFDGNTFGEYQKPTLDLAYRRRLNHLFGPINNYNQALLSSARPSSIPWGETDAFRNYFFLLYAYCNELTAIPKNLRANFLLEFLIQRRIANQNLANVGFTFGDRGFHNHVESIISALNAFITDRRMDINNLR